MLNVVDVKMMNFENFIRYRGAEEYEGVNIQNLLNNGCIYLQDHCPLSLLELTPYTDI